MDLFPRKTHFLHQARLQVFNDDIDICKQLPDDFLRLFSTHVQRHAFLAPVKTGEISARLHARLVFQDRRHFAGRSARARALDLDDLRSLIGKHHRALGACDLLLKTENFHAVKNSHAYSKPPSSLEFVPHTFADATIQPSFPSVSENDYRIPFAITSAPLRRRLSQL